jgi:hypothetical protein
MIKEYYVIPTIGKFKVTVTTTYDVYDKSKVLYYILNIGGAYNKCVNITIRPAESPRNKEIILSWAEVIGKLCTTNSQEIKGEATIEMVNLAFTIAQEIAPYAEYATLSDMSFFMCSVPDNGSNSKKKIKVSLPPYYIAFHDKTWYEDKFGATMINDEEYKKYRANIENMYKEGLLPDSFYFGNDRLREILYPLYSKARTWKEFFMLIEEAYPKTKCTLMYPWLHNAMSIIFQGIYTYAGSTWKIDLSKIPRVHYYQLRGGHGGGGGGGGYSRKYEEQYYDYRDVNYNDTVAWDIDRFLRRY